MTHISLTLPDPAALAALAAHLRVWLLQVLHWLIVTLGGEDRLPAALKRELRAELRDARAEVLNLIAALAVRRLRPVRRTRGGATAHGDPHVSRICARRALSRGLVGCGGSLRHRIAILLGALRRLDALVLRLVRRIASRPKGAWVVAIIEDAFAAEAPRALHGWDTS